MLAHTHTALRRFVRGSPRMCKDALVPVPRMGDSITEGTLIKFAVSPGHALKIDDIVCVIETDKVRRWKSAHGCLAQRIFKRWTHSSPPHPLVGVC